MKLLFEIIDGFGQKEIGRIGTQNADGAQGVQTHSARVCIGSVVIFFDDVHHFFAGGFLNIIASIKNTRNSGDGNAGFLGNIVNGECHENLLASKKFLLQINVSIYKIQCHYTPMFQENQ